MAIGMFMAVRDLGHYNLTKKLHITQTKNYPWQAKH